MQRVLLIEDDAAIERLLRLQFETAGVALDHVRDGYSAIDTIRGCSYDALILDLVLPHGLSGFGVLNDLELERPELVDRVFLATAMSEQTVLLAAPELLPRLFRKPFDDRLLVQTVLAFIARKPASQPPLEPAVLIVDDDSETALMMKGIVEAAGWAARIATDGSSAIAAILSGSVDAMILDLPMPGVDGFSVIEYLRQHQPALLARTIVVSGLPSPMRDRMIATDVCAVIEKLLRPGALLDALSRCLHPPPNEEGR
jgi:DNA-binding response OmpR family regulator